MDVQHFNVKVFVADPSAVHMEAFTGIFNSWIQRQVSEGELLVDVADYLHVPAGPGIVLVGHQANYGLDNERNRLGLLYNRKATVEGSNQDRIRQAVRAALTASRRLEQENQLQFSGQELQVMVNDRLLAPNSEESYSALKPDLQAVFDQLYGAGAYTMERQQADPRERLTINVRAAAPASVADLLTRLG